MFLKRLSSVPHQKGLPYSEVKRWHNLPYIFFIRGSRITIYLASNPVNSSTLLSLQSINASCFSKLEATLSINTSHSSSSKKPSHPFYISNAQSLRVHLIPESSLHKLTDVLQEGKQMKKNKKKTAFAIFVYIVPTLSLHSRERKGGLKPKMLQSSLSRLTMSQWNMSGGNRKRNRNNAIVAILVGKVTAKDQVQRGSFCFA